MKKKISSFLLFLALIPSFKAQIPNTSFENLNTDNSIKHWGAAILLAFVLDSSGNQTDSLKIDQGFCFSTNDAHTGSKAMEMRNAEWINAGEVIPGRARLSFNDSDFFAYNNPPVPVGSKPINFTFYYKFFPVNSDTALASISLMDSLSNEVGTAVIQIAGTHSVYSLASTPIVYSETVAPVFVAIDFITAKPYSNASYGTRFLADDVNLTTATVSTTGLSPLTIENRISSFPNPANKEVNLLLKKTSSAEFHIQLITAEGKRIDNIPYLKEGNILKINTEELPQGLYFINVMHEGYAYTAKFTK